MKRTLFAAGILFAGTAFAVDGVVLINQASVLAAGGFPYTITQPGSYKLTGNLTLPTANTDGIVIAADNVTLDLNGFGLIGPTVCTGFPVNSCAPTGTGVGIRAKPGRLFVYNGFVQGAGSNGLLLESSFSGTTDVDRVTARSNGSTGIYINQGRVTNSTAIGNGFVGIGTNIGAIETSYARDNGNVGIFCVARCKVTGNKSMSNRTQGIWIGGDGVVMGNTSTDNGQEGFVVACPSIIVENLASLNSGTQVSTLGAGCKTSNNIP